MELTELRDLISLLRKNGVTSYRSGDLELKLGAVAAKPAEESVPTETTEPQESGLDLVDSRYRELFNVQGDN